MARSGVSSYLTKSSSYPTSNYSSSYHPGKYGSKTYGSSYTKVAGDYSGRPYGSTSLRTHGSSTSGYLQSSSNYALSSSSYGHSSISQPLSDSRRGELSVDRYSRRDSFGTRSGVSSPTSRFLNNGYSSSYQPSSRAYDRNSDRNYGRFSQERTANVSRDLRAMSLGPRLPSIRRSSSQFDLMSSRASAERSSVGRDSEEKETEVYGSRIIPRVHPTMGAHAGDKSSDRRLGGSSEVETITNGRSEPRTEEAKSSYGSYRSGRRSPSTDRWGDGDDFEKTDRFSPADRFNSTKTSALPKSVVARSCSGLRNIGNTCFMNSVLQCLAHTQPLVEYCLESQYKADVNREASRMKGVLISAYAELMNSMWNGQDSVVSPTKFKCEVAQFAKLFLGYNQQDAQEFLLYLLQGLHEDINRVREKKKRLIDDSNEVETIGASIKARKSWKEHLEFENSKVVDLFEGQLKSALACTECGYVSNTFDPALGLSLPIKKNHGSSVSLVDCLELFTLEEVLDGHERTMCARCKKKQKSTKRLSIQKFPQILIINLKRFNDENAYRSKLSTDVKCPLRNLDLKMFAAEKMAGSIVYDLYAVSNHSGTPSGGHYTAAARNPFTKEWQYFNDHRVSSISEADVVTSEAYILFYELSSGSLTL